MRGPGQNVPALYISSAWATDYSTTQTAGEQCHILVPSGFLQSSVSNDTARVGSCNDQAHKMRNTCIGRDVSNTATLYSLVSMRTPGRHGIFPSAFFFGSGSK